MSAPPSGLTAAAPDQTSIAARLGLVFSSISTVLEFEFKKSRTWKRMLVWLGVALFPSVIICLMLFADESLPRGGWVTAIFVMACEMVVILNAMLWVAPIVQTELEGKTWLYIVARPYGRICLVVGKLLNGLVWTLGAGLLALALVGAVAWIKALPIEEITSAPAIVDNLTPEQAEAQRLLRDVQQRFQSDPEFRRMIDRSFPMTGPDGPFQGMNPEDFGFTPPKPEPPFASVGDAIGVGGLLAALAVLAGLTYSSLFCVIGCIIPKRAMLIAFSYTLVFETVVALVPAIINRVTIQYHLRCLLNRWVDLEVPVEGQQLFFSDWPAWWHVAVLAGMFAVWLIISLTVVHLRQYAMTDEN